MKKETETINKGQEEMNNKILETMLNKIEVSQLSDTKFTPMVIRKLNELTENYQKLKGN